MDSFDVDVCTIDMERDVPFAVRTGIVRGDGRNVGIEDDTMGKNKIVATALYRFRSHSKKKCFYLRGKTMKWQNHLLHVVARTLVLAGVGKILHRDLDRLA